MNRPIEIDFDRLLNNLEKIERHDNVQELLQKGVAAYIKEETMPRGTMLKLYPDGRRTLIQIDESFREKILRNL